MKTLEGGATRQMTVHGSLNLSFFNVVLTIAFVEINIIIMAYLCKTSRKTLLSVLAKSFCTVIYFDKVIMSK